MEVLHITPLTNGYEKVNLIANRVSRTNHFALIEKKGQEFMTGGYLLHDNQTNRKILDQFEKEDQYDIVHSLKNTPFAKAYSNE